MNYYFIYETFLGHRRIVSKQCRTEKGIINEMVYYPLANYCKVDKETYVMMHIGDEW